MKIDCRSENVQKALAIVERTFMPAPRELIAQALVKLRAKTIRREQGSDASQDIEFTVFAEELLKYPADVAISVLGDWPDNANNENRKWFPSWPELKDRLDAACSGRRYIRHELQKLARASGQPIQPKVELQEETPEHRAAVVEKCLASLGMAVQAPGGQRVSGRRTDTGTDAKIRNEAQARLDALEAEKPPLPKLSEAALKAAGLPVKRPEEND